MSDPRVRLFKEIARFQPTYAYLPILCWTGMDSIPVVAKVRFRDSHRAILPGEVFYTFEEAEVRAAKLNELDRIPEDIVREVHEAYWGR